MRLTPTQFLNALRTLSQRLEAPGGPTLTEHFGGQLTGTFTFTLRDPETGAVFDQVECNSLVDEGRNELLKLISDQPTQATHSFSGDGSTQTFQLPWPMRPVHSINSVDIGGTNQTWGSDYAVRCETGEIYFTSAPASGSNNVNIDLNYSVHPFNWLAVGTDNTAVADGQTSLQSEAERIPLDSGYYTHDPNGVQITGQWTFGSNQANVTIEEAGLFAVPSSAPVTGTMFNRTVVNPAISKSSSLDLQVTWVLSM